MIKIFRKIRQRLLTENKFSKYLIYAIGEILLVVIGILIALNINNWNENQKKEIQEIQYLKRLKRDFIQDTLYFNQRIENAENGIKLNTKAIQMAYDTQHNLKELQAVLELHSYYTEHLTTQNNTYLEMTNVGNLNIFQNEDLKIAIVGLYKDSDEAAKHVQEFNEFSTRYFTNMWAVIPFARYYPWWPELFNDEKMFYDSDWNFMNDPTTFEFKTMETCLAIYRSKHLNLLPYYHRLKSKSKSIIEMIDEELKTRDK
jgi:hypothetical protein